MAQRPQLPTFTTPPVTFVWPRLGEADTKFKAEGEFSVKLREAQAKIQPLIDKLQPLHDAAVSAGREAYDAMPVAARKKLEAKGGGFSINPLFNVVYDEETEEPTGDIEMNFKRVASGTYKTGKKTGQKWTAKVDVFDAKMKPMDGKKVWGGTVGKIRFEVSEYFIPGTGACGLSLRLLAAQIIELQSGGQRDASSYGFGQEEGYSDPGTQEESDTPNNDEGTDGAPDKEVDF